MTQVQTRVLTVVWTSQRDAVDEMTLRYESYPVEKLDFVDKYIDN